MALALDVQRYAWHRMALRRAAMAFLNVLSWNVTAVEGQETPASSSKPETSQPRRAWRLSPSEAEALEKKVKNDPSDIEARERLVTHYFSERDDAARAARARHVVWLIAHAPEEEITGGPRAGLDKFRDPGGQDARSEPLPSARELSPFDNAVTTFGSPWSALLGVGVDTGR